MDLKNAITVCLISLFSATMVLLIARVLDVQAASKLEPQLAAIVQELQAIRGQGGLAVESGAGGERAVVQDGLTVYYFHSSFRCQTCRAIESQAHDVVQSDFAGELESGELQWKALNYEEPSGADLAKKFEIQMPVVVLAKTAGGEISDWKALDRVWALVGDKPAYAEFVAGEIRKMLGVPQPAGTPTLADEGLGSTDSSFQLNDSAAATPGPLALPIPE